MIRTTRFVLEINVEGALFLVAFLGTTFLYRQVRGGKNTITKNE